MRANIDPSGTPKVLVFHFEVVAFTTTSKFEFNLIYLGCTCGHDLCLFCIWRQITQKSSNSVTRHIIPYILKMRVKTVKKKKRKFCKLLYTAIVVTLRAF